MKHPYSFIIGIDEVGRGCLAGPIVVAAVALPLKLKVKSLKFKVPLKDSKKLSAKQRGEWFGWIKRQMINGKSKIVYAIAHVRPKTIDRINISQAANLAATRALARLVLSMKYKVLSMKVLLDGGLYLNKILNTKYRILNTRTVVRGDEKFNCIKLASIVAKVHRDRIMKRNHKKYPQYGFDKHKGYGTRVHIAAIKKHGFCELHRLTFAKDFY